MPDPLPPEVAVADEDDRFGKFVRTSRLGSGGGGEVWKAWDTALGRWVALKFLKGVDAEEVARFKREAQLAATLAHPNIAAIYEVGEDRGRLFIAMQLVEGVTLDAVPKTDRSRLVRLVRDAARAVACAHDLGIIHRDLKPENFMVAADGRVLVLDFGLARHVTAERSGTSIVGTPPYMSPEQARGETLDARGDVYGLGATLYAILADRPPFEGTDVYEILEAVAEKDPKPLREIDPAVDRDLETVVLKCLAKERDRRYPTARALAADLDRWLRGETVFARPPSPLDRVARRLARHRALLAVGAAGVFLSAAFSWGAVRWLGRTEARATRVEEQLLDEMRATSKACLDAALDLRRAGDLAGMERQAARVDEICARVIAAHPGLAEPHYRVGRMRRALMRDAEALAEQDRALARERGYAPSLYERVVLTVRAWQERLEELERAAQRAHRAGPLPARKELAREDVKATELQHRVAADLQALEGGLGPAELQCAKGLQAWTRGEFVEARLRLEDALRIDPDLEEAVDTLAELWLEEGRPADAALLRERAAARDRGYAPHLLGLGRARIAMADAAGDEALYAAAVEAFDAAVRLGRADAALQRGGARVNRGLMRSKRGLDPSADYAAAADDFTRAGGDEAVSWRGVARSNLAAWTKSRGGDPGPLFTAAIEDFDEAIRLNPGRAETWRHRAVARVTRAGHLALSGFSPEPEYALAVADFDRAIEREPNLAVAWIGRGTAHTHWAQDRLARRADPSALFETAADDFRRALELAPGDADLWMRRASLQLSWGNFLLLSGRDGAPMLRGAVDDATAATRLDPTQAQAWAVRGNARAFWAAWRMGAKPEEASETFALAKADLDESLRLNPNHAATWIQLGTVHVNRGLLAIGAGDDAGPELARGIEALSRAVDLNPGDPTAWVHRGTARLYAARGSGAKSDYRRALDDYEAALKINGALAAGIAAELAECREAITR